MRVSGSNNFKLSQKYFLILIVLIGAFLRLVNLGTVPKGLYFDEVLYGLDSYSILKTGRDLYGHFLPLTFQSSGYYPPLYTYILVPFLAVLGLSYFSVRLPAALAGIGGVLAVYFLTKIVVGKKKSLAPLIASFLLAFSPWHIHLSRVAFLAGFGTIFIVLAVYIFLKFPDKKFSLATSAVLLAISTQIHYGYKLISPLLFILLVVWTLKKIKINQKKVILVIFIWLGAILVNGLAYEHYNAGFRANELRGKSNINIAKQYLNSFSFDFLFANGDRYPLENPWQKRGQLQLILLPFLVIGIARLGKIERPKRMILIAWLLLTPVASALAGLGTHSVRNSPMIIPLIILGAIGVEPIIVNSFRSILWRVFLILVIFIFCLETASYIYFYFAKYNKLYGQLWGAREREIVELVRNNESNVDKVVISDTYNVMLSYFAFETKQPSKIVQNAILKPTTIDSIPAKRIGNIYFIPTEEKPDKNFFTLIGRNTIFWDAADYTKSDLLDEIDLKSGSQLRYW